jgi:aspartate carbamoyltransferase catalytic subunit
VVGDILHSRVARSNIWGLLKLGAEVGGLRAATLLPTGIESFGVEVFRRVEEAIEWADALNVLRLQLERMQGGYVPSLREYNRFYGMTERPARTAPRDV